MAAARLLDFRHDRSGDTFRGWLRGIARNVLRAHVAPAGPSPRPAAAPTRSSRSSRSPTSTPTRTTPTMPRPRSTRLNRLALELVRGEFEPKTWELFWQVAVEGKSPVDVATAQPVHAGRGAPGQVADPPPAPPGARRDPRLIGSARRAVDRDSPAGSCHTARISPLPRPAGGAPAARDRDRPSPARGSVPSSGGGEGRESSPHPRGPPCAIVGRRAPCFFTEPGGMP